LACAATWRAARPRAAAERSSLSVEVSSVRLSHEIFCFAQAFGVVAAAAQQLSRAVAGERTGAVARSISQLADLFADAAAQPVVHGASECRVQFLLRGRGSVQRDEGRAVRISPPRFLTERPRSGIAREVGQPPLERRVGIRGAPGPERRVSSLEPEQT